MKKVSFADMHCSVAQALEVIGEWWTLLILRDAFFGVTRFEEFQSRLAIARNILTARLDNLVDAGVLERCPYDEARSRYDYVLTDMGRALWPVLTTIRQWGDDWVVEPGQEPVRMVHTGCGAHARAELACEHCGEWLTLAEVRAVPGPGLEEPAMLRGSVRSRRS